MGGSLDIKVFSSNGGSLPPFRIGDKVLICTPAMYEEGKWELDVAKSEAEGDDIAEGGRLLAEAFMKIGLRGVLVGRSDDYVTVDNLMWMDGRPADQPRQTVGMNSIVAVLQQRRL